MMKKENDGSGKSEYENSMIKKSSDLDSLDYQSQYIRVFADDGKVRFNDASTHEVIFLYFIYLFIYFLCNISDLVLKWL